MDILKTAHNLGKKLRKENSPRNTALKELQRIGTQLEELASSNAPEIWKKRRRAQLLFEQATAQRFVSSCR